MIPEDPLENAPQGSVLSSKPSGQIARRVFFASLSLVFLYVVYPLLFPVLMGGVLAVLLTPWVARIEKKRIPPSLASLLVTVGVTLVFLMPAAVLVYQGAKTGVQELQQWREAPQREIGDWSHALFDVPAVHQLLVKFTDWFPIGMQDLTETLQDTVRSVGTRAAEFLAGLLASLPGMAFALIIIGVSLYFFLVDGRKLVVWIKNRSIFGSRETDRLLSVLAGVCRSVVLASVVSGIAQSLFYVFFVIVTGSPDPIVMGMVIFLASFVPVIGAGPVTFGLGLQQLLFGRTVAGIILLIAAVLTAMLDNFVRPWFLKGSVNLHPLLAFIAAFGGLQAFGFVGVFFGPIIAALFLALIEVVGAGS